MEPLTCTGSPQILRSKVWRSEVLQDQLVMVLRCSTRSLGCQDGCGGCGCRGGDTGPLLVLGLKQVHPRSAMDQLRGVWMSQDRKPEECTKANESAMAVMNLLKQNRDLKVWCMVRRRRRRCPE